MPSLIKEQFVIRYYEYAKKASEKSDMPILFALAQCALETGWAKHIKGNMMFGMKKGSGRNYGGWTERQTQLITTTEYSNSNNRKFPFIFYGYPIRANGKWKYKIKDVFRAYPSPLYSFIDWAGLLFQNRRYRYALQYKKDPYRFAEEIANAGYATDPNYARKVKRIMKDIEQIIALKKLNRKKTVPMIPIALMLISVAIIAVVVLKRNSNN
ncbi:glycoside hydrolase family 73 protein [Aquimarina longa]|uniref:glycoside hydrolase family 73 protein n=1 Tax=Aquimarina longa TaxID=1080221 RepID=UPI000782BB13|nr:glucosaminidase domain-containing protein [Aquimarina longa]